MKMTTVAAVAGLLLCCFASSDSADNCDVYGKTGGSVTLKLEHELTKSLTLKWTHGNEVIFERSPDGLNTGKEDNIHKNGSLRLRNVTKREGGKYKPEIFEDGQSRGNLKAISLCVLDPVSKPRANHTCQGKVVIFNCFVSKGSEVGYKWLQNDKEKSGETNSLLKIPKNKLAGEERFTCIVHNRVSSESAEPVRYTCGQEPGFRLPETVLGINTWIIVGVGGGVVLLLIVLVLICCIHNRRRQRMQIKDELELRLDWTGSQQQHADQHRCRPPGQQQHPNHHHPHHHQQHPAGHTGPRQHRSKGQLRPRAPEGPGSHPQPSPRRAAQGPRPVPDSEEQPPPLPQPRKKAPRATKA